MSLLQQLVFCSSPAGSFARHIWSQSTMSLLIASRLLVIQSRHIVPQSGLSLLSSPGRILPPPLAGPAEPGRRRTLLPRKRFLPMIRTYEYRCLPSKRQSNTLDRLLHMAREAPRVGQRWGTATAASPPVRAAPCSLIAMQVPYLSGPTSEISRTAPRAGCYSRASALRLSNTLSMRV